MSYREINHEVMSLRMIMGVESYKQHWIDEKTSDQNLLAGDFLERIVRPEDNPLLQEYVVEKLFPSDEFAAGGDPLLTTHFSLVIENQMGTLIALAGRDEELNPADIDELKRFIEKLRRLSGELDKRKRALDQIFLFPEKITKGRETDYTKDQDTITANCRVLSQEFDVLQQLLAEQIKIGEGALQNSLRTVK